MNSHPKQIKLHYVNWLENDWQNLNEAFGKEWSDVRHQDSAYHTGTTDERVNAYGDFINRCSVMVHQPGPYCAFRPEDRSVSTSKDMLEVIREFFDE